MIKSIIKNPYFLSFILLLLINVIGIKFLQDSGVYLKIVPVKSFNDIKYNYSTKSKIYLYFNQELKKAKITKLQGEKQINSTVEWVMNSLPSMYNSQNKNPIAIYKSKRGNCYDRSIILFICLKSLGWKVRMVNLQADFYNIYTAHTVIEVFENGHWIVYDPTFNVYFVDKNNHKLSAQEISMLLKYNQEEVKPVILGKVKYRAKLEKYYLNWKYLFNNVIVIDVGNHPYLTYISYYIPILMNFYAPKLYYYAPNSYASSHILYYQKIFTLNVLILPILETILFVLLIITFFRSYRNKIRVDECLN